MMNTTDPLISHGRTTSIPEDRTGGDNSLVESDLAAAQDSEIRNTDDYAEILKKHGLAYKVAGYYLQVGEISQVQGWILHLSSIRSQVYELLQILIPTLMTENVPFKIAPNKITAICLINGAFGYTELGKVVCIYPPNDAIVLSLAEKLIRLTAGFRGPDIPTDIHLGGTVYVRYGGFNPEIFCDASGNQRSYIYNAVGQLVEDIEYIPFQMPGEVRWPFNAITTPVHTKSDTLQRHGYKTMSVLKADAKGRVIKALRLKGFRIQWCIVKEGKRDMNADEAGRDICDMLQWQYQLQQELSGEVPVPKAYDFFRENDNAYLVMEFIPGISLHEVVGTIYEGSCWRYLDSKKRLVLLDYLIDILSHIKKLHQNGYIHRDITPLNFILDKQNQFFMIDLELVYADTSKTPDPPFILGTDGFMSPEQQAVQQPTIKEDIYGLGGLMVFFFTNLFPTKFETESPTLLESDLYFFIQNSAIAALIAQCFDPNPAARPELDAIESTVRQYRTDIKDQSQPLGQESLIYKKTVDMLWPVISQSLMTLNSPVLKEPGNMWHSNILTAPQQVVNRNISSTYSIGLFAGLSGVMYLIARAKEAGMAVDNILGDYRQGYNYLQYNFSTASNAVPGLYAGAAGVAVAISLGIQNQLIEPTQEALMTIQRCLSFPVAGSNLANGVAGQGMAVLLSLPSLDDAVAQKLLRHYRDLLLARQQKDGSWLQERTGEKSCMMKITNLAYGVAGIVCFLSEYYKRCPDSEVQHAVLKALSWLSKQAHTEKNGAVWWYVNDKEKLVSPWLLEGTTGIALSFIRAYETFQNPVYKQMAEKALEMHPRYLVNQNLNQANGITGVGEVYLEAFRVFQSTQWQERADWIANVLVHTCRYQSHGSCLWQIDSNLPTADFMVGNGGIIHFLIRYAFPDKLEFPLLPSTRKLIQSNGLGIASAA